MSSDHAQSLRLGQRGFAPTPGVQLVAVASLPSVAYRGQIVYALDIDEFRVFDGDAWQIPTAHDTAGLQMFVGPTAPVADNIGDFWLKDTTYQIYVWDGTVWREVQDPTADAAAAAAAAAQADALDALDVANDAQATADGKVTTFYQSGEPALPTEDPQQGDIWFRTSDNRAFIYNAGDWVEIQDQDIVDALDQAGTAQATADQKISSYYQTSPPWADGSPGHGNDIGDLWFDTNDSNKCYRWDGNWTPVRDATIAVAQGAADAAQADADAAAAAAAAAQATADDALDAATTDGAAPTSSPAPFSLAGIGFFIVKWDAITNADPVTYEVHVSSTTGFTAGPTTLVGMTSGTQYTIRQLPGTAPNPGDPDPRVLDYDTTYYARVIAKDADGSAAQSAQAVCTLFRVTGVDLQVDSVTAANIVAGTLTGELFSANVIVSGVFKTADTGQRVEFGIAGIKGYKSTGELMVSFPTADGEEALFDGEMIARGLTVLGGASLYGDSELNADSTLVLQKGITQPSATPQIGSTYDYVMPSTASLSSAQKTGALGTFDFNAAEVSCIEWRTTLNCFSMYQVRPGGTREWYIDVAGAPVAVSGNYFAEWDEWDIRSATEMLASGTPAKNGHYLFFRFIPSGSDYYCYAANGNLFRYSRQNGLRSPVMGNNGTDVYVAEIISTSHLNIRYFNLTATGPGLNFPSPGTTYESSQGFNTAHQIAVCLYGSYDVGNRYLYGIQGSGLGFKMLTVSGTGSNSIFPGGSSNNWASANVEAESFEAATGNRRSTAYDGTQFWSLHGDGFLYKHTNEHWDPAVSSSTFWGQVTYYDSAGTTHETLPGVAKSYPGKRRSKNFFTPPDIPSGGVDDPNNVRLYMGRGSTQPSNSNFHLQYTGTTATTWTTMATATASPPTSNNFPAATAAKIINDDSSLIIDANGDITGVDGVFTTMAISGTATKGGNAIAVEGPYYYATVTSAPAAANNTITIISGYTVIASSGITVSTGVFTLPRAGRYLLYGQLYWALQSPTPTGDRLAQWLQNGSTVASHTASPSATSSVVTAARKTIVAAANDTVTFRYRQTAGGSAGPQITTLDLSYITIEYIGA